MKIAVITPLFTLAGVPLAQMRFARALSKAGHEVEFLIGNIEDKYDIPNNNDFKIINLNFIKVRNSLFTLAKYIYIKKPHVIFTAEDHLNIFVILAAILTRSKVKISASSRVTPFDTYSNKVFTKGWFLKIMMNAIMWRADVLTCVSIDMVEQYKSIFKKSRHICIYNIIIDDISTKRIEEPIKHDWIDDKKYPLLIAAGRLAPWKGFEYLIQAIKILSENIQVRLIILGDGPLREKLQKLINELNLNDYISLLGYVENPLKYFSKADIFVLSSTVEGLPNVLVESMMCGCTPVATDCPTGPR